ncbi:MAG TPA: nucleoside triphosphate pyrophosphohydrolase [Anaerolineales bacterium]|jgi:tetrapyrrole methylase family protein/MazG family protein|nr:nucleoside triphosphate pyrophosphohydrolase [Anaerolineales bacterium]HQX15892.1 nucleoside triphosphate pyrophosphohydrolase [Anaerolineales bacterium]
MDFSIVSSTFDALRIPPPARLTLLDASTLASAHVPPFPPDMPALILGIDSKELALRVREVLLAMYPATHGIVWVESGKWNSSTSLRAREERGLGELENFAFSGSSCLYVPALGEGTSFESFAEIVAHLRAPNGCPWDREQTHESLRKHLLEESYEAISAIDAGDFAHMREEFGDLLLQIVLQAQIANEEGQFNISQVIQGIHSKIVRRHPHVFGDLKLDGVDDVLANWEKLKEKERGKKKDNKGLLDGVPLALPALSQAQEYQDRAARVGFDWNEIDGVLDKVKEEIEEIKHAESDFELASEIGDLFFVLVNFARWKNVDAESVLRGTNAKFKKRFAYVEQGAKKQGRNLSELSLEEMESLWQEAKRFD